MKRSIRKFRKWIKYKFSTYYPDPCDFTIYESYAYETPIISLADSYQARWQKLSELTRFGDSRDSTTNPPLLENPLDNIKDQLDKLFGIEDSQTISLSKGFPARTDKLSIKSESFNKAFKKAIENTNTLPDEIVIDSLKSTKPIFCTDLDDGTPTLMDVETCVAVYNRHLNRYELKTSVDSRLSTFVDPLDPTFH